MKGILMKAFSSCHRWTTVVGVLMLISVPGVATASASTPPMIESESVSGVTATNATLKAQIDPHEGNAYYQFQLVSEPSEYLSEFACPTEEFPAGTSFCTVIPEVDGALPINLLEEAETVSLNLESLEIPHALQPGTEYHYRVIVATAIPTEDTIEWEEPIVLGEDQAFTTPTSASLAVDIEEGEGTVVSNPAGIECGVTCSAEFEEGSKVTLTASPAPGYLFKGWTRCDSGGVNGRQCTVTITISAKEVGARFVKVWTLDIFKAGSGLGKVQTSPGGILCSHSCSHAEAVFKGGSVTVKEAPAKHNHFVQWIGLPCDESTDETCTFEMNEDQSLSAGFAPDAQYALSVSKEGGGQGSVKSKPSGLLCAYTCSSASASFYSGESVEIEIKLNKGTTKLTWSTGAGTCTGSTEAAISTCTVPMSSAGALVAKFE